MREIFTVRSVVEAAAIRRTAQRIQPAQLDALAVLIAEMRAAGTDGDMMALAESDLAFHQRLLQWSDHRALLRVWLPLHTQVERFVVMTHPHYFPDLVAIADTHLPILDALRAGDSDRAARQIEEHIMLIWTRFERSKPRRSDTP
jgi:DNA-binding GntR family transcriptional regulator